MVDVTALVVSRQARAVDPELNVNEPGGRCGERAPSPPCLSAHLHTHLAVIALIAGRDGGDSGSGVKRLRSFLLLRGSVGLQPSEVSSCAAFVGRK